MIIPGAEMEQATSVRLAASSGFAAHPLASSDLSYPRHFSSFPSPSIGIAFD